MAGLGRLTCDAGGFAVVPAFAYHPARHCSRIRGSSRSGGESIPPSTLRACRTDEILHPARMRRRDLSKRNLGSCDSSAHRQSQLFRSRISNCRVVRVRQLRIPSRCNVRPYSSRKCWCGQSGSAHLIFTSMKAGSIMRSISDLMCVAFLMLSATAYAADPLMNSAQSLFKPLPLSPPALAGNAAHRPRLPLAACSTLTRGYRQATRSAATPATT